MGVFADLTHDEYRAKALGYRASLRTQLPLRAAPFLYESTVPPKEVDWVAKGAVTSVRGAPVETTACALEGAPCLKRLPRQARLVAS